ncbi:MAG: competence/damage-inducible protein A [Geminicoccaceae bacterium]|nr:competence/damage-inducible protein A [Geminicoccaceae bacterium]
MSDAQGRVTAGLVVIGNEILSGRTQDANTAYLARFLNDAGVRLMEVRVVPDVEADIVEAVNQLRRRHAYLFTTGGIGPTHDDITSAAVAKALGRPLTRHPEAERRLFAYYPEERRTPARMKMADTPEGADLVDNPISTAPGFRVENVFVLAGVPKIMQAMLDGVRPLLKGGRPVSSRTLKVEAGEGDVAATLSEVQARHGAVDIGSYPFFQQGLFGTSVVVRSDDGTRLDEAFLDLERALAEQGVATAEEGG